MDYKKKYLKYKKKYINELKQFGGTKVVTNKVSQKTKIDKFNNSKTQYLSIYNKEIKKLKEKYKKVEMCCDDKKGLINLLKDIEKIMEMKEIEPNLGRLHKYLEKNIKNEQRKEMMIDVLRIFLDEDYYSRREKIDKMKKYFEENKKIPLKNKCDNLGKQISSSYWGLKFYENNNNKKSIIKEKIITHYDIKSNNTLFSRNVSSILDEIEIFKLLEKENFTSKLLDYYICEKQDELILYMEIEKKGTPLSKWLEDDNILTENHKNAIKEVMKKLHKLNIIYNSSLEADNLLIDTTGSTPKFYISNFEKSDTKAHIFSKAKKEDMKRLELALEWATPFEENVLKALIICDIGVKFTF
tara:strand:- start:6915 stop:7982 length:1068 start_codon:yes stop_codon:yes gene_type:complete